MRLLFHWLVSALAIIIASYLLPGVAVSGLVAALIVAVVLGAINIFVKPILVLLTLPITILTLGLFIFVLDALLIMLAAQIVPGFSVTGFLPALLFAVALAIISAVFHNFEKSDSTM